MTRGTTGKSQSVRIQRNKGRQKKESLWKKVAHFFHEWALGFGGAAPPSLMVRLSWLQTAQLSSSNTVFLWLFKEVRIGPAPVCSPLPVQIVAPSEFTPANPTDPLLVALLFPSLRLVRGQWIPIVVGSCQRHRRSFRDIVEVCLFSFDRNTAWHEHFLFLLILW